MGDGQDKRPDDQTVKVSNDALRDLRASATTPTPDAHHDASTRSLDRRNLDALIQQERSVTQAEPFPGLTRRPKHPSEPAAHEVITREVTPVLNPALTPEAQERSYSQEVTAAVPSEVLAKLREGAPATRLKAPTQHVSPEPVAAPKPIASDAWDDFDDSFLEASLGTESSHSALELTTSALHQALIPDQDDLATTRMTRSARATRPEADAQPELAPHPVTADAPLAGEVSPKPAPATRPQAEVEDEAEVEVEAAPQALTQAPAQEKTPDDAQRGSRAPITPQPHDATPLAVHDQRTDDTAEPQTRAPQATPEAAPPAKLIPAPAPAQAPQRGISRQSLGLAALVIIGLLLLGALALSGKIG